MLDWEKGDMNDTAVVEDCGEKAEGESIGVFEMIVNERGMNDEVIRRGIFQKMQPAIIFT
jgi:hypothetical protein